MDRYIGCAKYPNKRLFFISKLKYVPPLSQHILGGLGSQNGMVVMDYPLPLHHPTPSGFWDIRCISQRYSHFPLFYCGSQLLLEAMYLQHKHPPQRPPAEAERTHLPHFQPRNDEWLTCI